MMNEINTSDLNAELVRVFRGAELESCRELRRDAIAAFEKLGLPGAKNEEYRFTPITRSLEKYFSAADFTADIYSAVTSINEYLIPSWACNLIVFVNGRYNETLSKTISPPDQILIMPLTKALAVHAGTIAPYFAKLAEPATDAFAALNTAFWQSGVFIHVPKNVRVEKPVFILHLLDATQQPNISQTRVVAVLEENSEVSIVEKSNCLGALPAFSSTVEEMAVKEYATLNYCKIQNDPGMIHQVANTCIHQRKGSHVNTFTITLDGQVIRNNLRIIIDGERCESHFYGLSLLHKKNLADHHTVVDHQKPNSFSNELYKGIMDGNARGVFNGKIYVRPHAQKTNAFQSNRNILLSDTATIHTKPQLEIWADDVKCSHGCTSGQLDEEAIFYLQSRGISRHIARAMVLYAFAGEVLQPIKDPALKNYLDDLVSQRLQQNF